MNVLDSTRATSEGSESAKSDAGRLRFESGVNVPAETSWEQEHLVFRVAAVAPMDPCRLCQCSDLSYPSPPARRSGRTSMPRGAWCRSCGAFRVRVREPWRSQKHSDGSMQRAGGRPRTPWARPRRRRGVADRDSRQARTCARAASWKALPAAADDSSRAFCCGNAISITTASRLKDNDVLCGKV